MGSYCWQTVETLIETLVWGVEPLNGFNSPNQAGEGIGIIEDVYYVISTLWRVDERSSALLTIYFYHLWNQGIEPPEALQQAKDWLRELTNGKLGEWYAGELLPLLREAEFENIFFFEREASRLQKKSAKIGEKPYEHPYHWAAFTITGNG